VTPDVVCPADPSSCARDQDPMTLEPVPPVRCHAANLATCEQGGLLNGLASSPWPQRSTR